MASSTLVFVAGASPQIITETVYSLLPAQAGTTDVYILTTKTGRGIIRGELLGPGGHWRRLQTEHAIARRFRLTDRHLIVLKGVHGAPLDDVRSREDNEAAADQIAAFVARHTRSGAPPLHASVAGGRKTMGYLLAAAMMIYGRPEDRLSHVLVHPPALEGTDFYFLPRQPPRTLVHRRPRGATVRVPAREARIELTDLPFLRLRAVRDMGLMRGGSFTGLVAELQADLEALTQPRVLIRPQHRRLVCGNREVPLSPLRMTIYTLLAERRLAGCGRGDCTGCSACFVPAAEIAGPFADSVRERMRTVGSWGAGSGWGERQFRPEVSKINNAIVRSLRRASQPYEIQGTGERGRRLYGLRLPVPAIQIVAA